MAEKPQVAKPKPVKECKPHTACDDGRHTFIVTGWQVGNGKEKAIAMRCQHCLMPMDLSEVESLEWAKKEGLRD